MASTSISASRKSLEDAARNKSFRQQELSVLQEQLDLQIEQEAKAKAAADVARAQKEAAERHALSAAERIQKTKAEMEEVDGKAREAAEDIKKVQEDLKVLDGQAQQAADEAMKSEKELKRMEGSKMVVEDKIVQLRQPLQKKGVSTGAVVAGSGAIGVVGGVGGVASGAVALAPTTSAVAAAAGTSATVSAGGVSGFFGGTTVVAVGGRVTAFAVGGAAGVGIGVVLGGYSAYKMYKNKQKKDLAKKEEREQEKQRIEDMESNAREAAKIQRIMDEEQRKKEIKEFQAKGYQKMLDERNRQVQQKEGSAKEFLKKLDEKKDEARQLEEEQEQLKSEALKRKYSEDEKERERASAASKKLDLLAEMERVKVELAKAEEAWAESERKLQESAEALEKAETEVADHGDIEKFQETKNKIEDRMMSDLKNGRYKAIADATRTEKKSIAVLGPRGAGKSSTINALCGAEVTETGATDTTLEYAKVCEFPEVELWDSPGDTPARSLVNLKILTTMKTMHMVMVLYHQDVTTTFTVLKACKSLNVPCCAVRNMFTVLPGECKCRAFSKRCRTCVHAQDVAKVEAAGLTTTFLDGKEISVPVVFISATGPDGVGMADLRCQLNANSIFIQGVRFDVVAAKSSHALLDVDWIAKVQFHLQTDEVKAYEEMLELFVDNGLLNEDDVEELEGISKKKNAEWKSWGLTDDVINSYMPIYWYSLERPSVYCPVSKILNNPHTRGNDTVAVPIGMRFIKWLIDGALDLDDAFHFFGQAFRGIRYEFGSNDWDKFKPGNIFCWYTVKSVTSDMDALLTLFAEDKSENTPLTIFIIEDCSGKNIQSLSCFQEEKEVLLLPGAVFKVLDRVRGTAGSDDLFARADKIIIQMEGNVLLSPEEFSYTGQSSHGLDGESADAPTEQSSGQLSDELDGQFSDAPIGQSSDELSGAPIGRFPDELSGAPIGHSSDAP